MKNRIEEAAELVARIYSEIQTQMLMNMAQRLSGDIEDITEWQNAQLSQINNLTEANIQLIMEHGGIARDVMAKVLHETGYKSLEENEKIFLWALRDGADLIEPEDIQRSASMAAVLSTYERRARDTLNLVNSTMLSQSEQVYRDVINKTVGETLAGVKSSQQALRDAVREWSHHGIPALVDKQGRRWGAEGYVRMVTRTTVGQVTHDMQQQRMQEWGADLIEVSSHAGARPLCAPYQGKIFSMSGSHPRYPAFSTTSYGSPAGLFGINCGHVQYPFFEGLSTKRYKPTNQERNERIYENSQEQRRIEREIRKLKTEKRTMEKLRDEEGVKQANAKVRAKQKKMREFIDSTGRTRRRGREQIYS